MIEELKAKNYTPNKAAWKKHVKNAIEDALSDNSTTTLVTLGSASSEKASMNTRSYRFFLLDEAAQAAEHESCCGLARVNNLGGVCLAGDHQQLPPFSRNEKVKEFTQLSMMERLHSLGVTCVLLDTQYRMHEAIAGWPSQDFYINPSCRQLRIYATLTSFQKGFFGQLPRFLWFLCITTTVTKL